MWAGLDLALGAADWAQLRDLTPAAFGQWLREATVGMDLDDYRKTTRGPKKPKVQVAEGEPINQHTSTFRFFQQRKQVRNKSSP